jgi:hypothetical protein
MRRIDRGLDDRDLAGIDLKLLGEEHREGGMDVLAHLVAMAGERDRPVRGDRDPGVGLEGRRRRLARRHDLGRGALLDLAAENEAAADEGRDFEEAAAGQRSLLAHA